MMKFIEPINDDNKNDESVKEPLKNTSSGAMLRFPIPYR